MWKYLKDIPIKYRKISQLSEENIQKLSVVNEKMYQLNVENKCESIWRIY